MLKILLNIFSILSLVSAGLVLVLCANQWLEFAHNDIKEEGPSIVEIFQNIGHIHSETDQERISPLVSQAEEFVLIINPPKPPEVKKPEPAQPGEVQPPRVALAPRPSVKFKLLSTSCNRDRPEDSVALIDEPGRGEHWAKAGDNIGNFVLERIEPGTIIYRYGSSFDHEALDRQVSEMAVEINQPVRIVRESTSPFDQTQGRRQVERKSIL